MVGYLPHGAFAKGAGAGPRRSRGCRAHSTRRVRRGCCPWPRTAVSG